MNDSPVSAGPWIREAYALAASDLLFWGITSTCYVALGTLALRIPFIGHVLLIFLTPLVIAGALKEAQKPQPEQGLMRRLRHVVSGVLRDHNLALSVMIIATVDLGAWVFLTVLALLFGVDSSSLAQLFAMKSLGPALFSGVLLLLFWCLQIALSLTTLYILAAITLSGLKPLDALEYAVGVWRKAPLLLTGFGAAFVLPLILASYSYAWLPVLIAQLTLIPLTLAIYVSYDFIGPHT